MASDQNQAKSSALVSLCPPRFMGLQERGDLCQPLLYRETVNRQRLRNCTIVGVGPALDLCTKSEELAPIVWPNLSSAGRQLFRPADDRANSEHWR